MCVMRDANRSYTAPRPGWLVRDHLPSEAPGPIEQGENALAAAHLPGFGERSRVEFLGDIGLTDGPTPRRDLHSGATQRVAASRASSRRFRGLSHWGEECALRPARSLPEHCHRNSLVAGNRQGCPCP